MCIDGTLVVGYSTIEKFNGKQGKVIIIWYIV